MPQFVIKFSKFHPDVTFVVQHKSKLVTWTLSVVIGQVLYSGVLYGLVWYCDDTFLWEGTVQPCIASLNIN